MKPTAPGGNNLRKIATLSRAWLICVSLGNMSNTKEQ